LSKKWKRSCEIENDITIVNYAPPTSDESKELDSNRDENPKEDKLFDTEQQTMREIHLCSGVNFNENISQFKQDEEQSSEKVPTSTFNLMKDAFLNLRGPSYVIFKVALVE
jgi:hypothetical protein